MKYLLLPILWSIGEVPYTRVPLAGEVTVLLVTATGTFPILPSTTDVHFWFIASNMITCPFISSNTSSSSMTDPSASSTIWHPSRSIPIFAQAKKNKKHQVQI